MNASAPPPGTRRDEDMLVGALPALDAGKLDAPTRRVAIAMTLAFWLANISVQMFRSHLEGHPDLGALLLARSLTAAGGLTLCFAVHLVIARLAHHSFAARAATLTLIVPFAADACAWLSYLSMQALAPAHVTGGATSSATIQAVLYWVWFFFAWAALYLALRYSFEVKASERRARIVQGLAHAAQLRALQNQISPHFMFNTLNSISALMLDGRGKEAEAMLRRLSDFLRATLSLDALADITLAEELRIQRIYLGIEHARFPDMKVTVDCPDALADALVPALITQPLVENAVKYGVARSLRATAIAIQAREEDNHLILTVTDDGATAPAGPGGLGVGLRNVADRLASRFGADHRFEAGPGAEGGFTVQLALPLTREPPARAAA